MMKIILALTILGFSLMGWGNIEADPTQSTEPSPSEVSQARLCFKKLQDLGCGHPRDDQMAFRACLKSSFSDLGPNCQKTMSEIYKIKN